MKIFLVYILVISIISVIACVFDKWAARHKKRRIRERTLMIYSIFGGAAAMYITMCIIRHKTKHTKFMLGLPAIILLQTAILLVFCRKFS